MGEANTALRGKEAECNKLTEEQDRLVAQLVEQARVGTVTGLVGAAGGLGGYFPPLVMGAVHQTTNTYTLGFVLLAVVALGASVYTAVAFRERKDAPTARGTV